VVSIRHIIFDCDGVLVDSEPLSMRADVALLKSVGLEMSEAEAHRRFVGKTFQAMLNELTAEFGVCFPPDFILQKDDLVEQMYRAELKEVEGVAGMLQALSAFGVTFSIGSNSPRRRVELAVKLTGLADFFQDITTKDDVPNGKPAPDVYLRAVEKAGLLAEHCVVLEDSVTGVTAGVAALIRTLGFTGSHPAPDELGPQLLAAGASMLVRDMRELARLVTVDQGGVR
jgi:HAD superfamily hydrolase (TIGR01509 family)